MQATARQVLIRQIGSVIRALREAKGWSQKQLGAALPRPETQTTISRWETGHTDLRDFGIMKMLEIEQTLGVAPGYILQECAVLHQSRANGLRSRIKQEPTLTSDQANVLLAVYDGLRGQRVKV